MPNKTYDYNYYLLAVIDNDSQMRLKEMSDKLRNRVLRTQSIRRTTSRYEAAIRLMSKHSLTLKKYTV